jgi:hypothetical protein
VQIGAALYQQQAEPGARPRSNVAATMKGLEQMLLIFLRNADPLVLDGAYCIRPGPLNFEAHRCPRLRIFHGVTQEICKNVPQQSFISVRWRWRWAQP